MKASATQLRIALLVLNIGLGIGIPAYAAFRYKGLSDPKTPSVTIVDVKKLEYNESAAAAKSDTAAQDRLRHAAQNLQPQPPPPPVTPPEPGTGEKPPKVETPGQDVLDPGKLAEEGWYYAEFVLRYDDPENSLVVLRKKDPNAQPGAPPGANLQGSTRTNPRAKPAPRPVRTQNVRAGGKPGPQQPTDQVSFLVKSRWVHNEELGLNFYVDSADQTQLVYWLPDKWVAGKGPSTRYALKYVPDSIYENSDPNERKLAPPPLTPEEKAAAEQKNQDGKAVIVIRHSADFEFDTSKEYKDLIEGKLSPHPADQESKGGLVPAKKKEGEGAESPGAIVPSSGKPPMPQPAPPQPKGAIQPASGPRAATPEDFKQLKEGMKGIPKDAQKQVLDAMKGIKPAK